MSSIKIRLLVLQIHYILLGIFSPSEDLLIYLAKCGCLCIHVFSSSKQMKDFRSLKCLNERHCGTVSRQSVSPLF